MLSMVHQFYAMASDCAVHLCGEAAEYLELLAAAAEAEVRRIEARYSRYRGDSELARINKVAATGGVIDIDAETAGLIAYAKACFAKSDGAFDITSGLLRMVWDFSVSRLPDQASIDAVLPFVGLDNVGLVDSQLHFRRPGSSAAAQSPALVPIASEPRGRLSPQSGGSTPPGRLRFRVQPSAPAKKAFGRQTDQNLWPLAR